MQQARKNKEGSGGDIIIERRVQKADGHNNAEFAILPKNSNCRKLKSTMSLCRAGEVVKCFDRENFQAL